ncbi:MAG TPA: hypothetical protein PLJ35_09745 [Anaerolineae bacterium]|nr:hypothetical protein [Anaerolineae bacterium]HOQ99091.1 hypothetical protein [Anaerolineae bacterium]
MNDERFAGAIPVQSVAEEYRRVRQERCPCGGRYQVGRQALLEDDAGRHYDCLDATCEQCGAERTFLFDISSFFGY